jgi:nucleotide-binding universal stress UspA family protein
VTAASTPASMVIGFDGSDQARHAIEVAARLMPGAHARIVTVQDPWVPLERSALARIALPDSVIVPAAKALEREVEQSARDTAERGRALAQSAGLDVTCEVVADTAPWRGLGTAARSHRVDAIVCGSRGRSGVARAILGTTSDALLHHAPAPVLIVPPADEIPDGPVVVGYDGSEPAAEAIRVAALLFPGRRAVIAHAWMSPLDRNYAGEALLGTPLDDVQDLAEGLEEAYAASAQELADEGTRLAREAGLDARATATASSGGGWRGLSAIADAEDAATLVAGCRGRGAIASTVLGSVSAGLAHNATRPVLITRSPQTR